MTIIKAIVRAILATITAMIRPIDVDAIAAAAAAAAFTAAEEKRKADQRARQDRCRARKKAPASCHVTPNELSRDTDALSRDTSEMPVESANPRVEPPRLPGLSLLKKNLNLKEREKEKGGAGERGPLPPDFEANEKNRAMARERGLDARGLADVVTKFRDWYADDPKPRTPGQWQRLLEQWIKTERPDSPRLPLMRVASTTAVPIAQLPLPDDPVWAPVYGRLKAEFGEAVAASWFSRCRLALDGEAATISLPTKFLVSYLESRFREQVLCAIAAEHAGVIRLRFVFVPEMPVANSRKEASNA